MTGTVLLQIFYSAIFLAVSVLIQLAGLSRITAVLDWWRGRRHKDDRGWRATTMGIVVYLLFLLHLLQITAYAAAYFLTGAVRPFESALYFSAATFSTIGGGAVRTAQPWELFAALEGLSGIVLVGWSVSFLVAMVHRLGLAADEQ